MNTTKIVAVARNTPATVTIPALRVYLRCAFFVEGEGECWFPGTGVANVSFEIDDKPVQGKRSTTNKPHAIGAGLLLTVSLHPDLRSTTRAAARAKSVEGTDAILSLAGVEDGDHVLRVVPDAKSASSVGAGPKMASTEDRLYRPVSIRISLKQGLLTKAEEFDPADPDAKVVHGHVTAFKGDELCIDLKPDWMKTTAGVHKRSQAIDLIVIHHTGGKTIGGALNEALTAKGPHYEIDPEGHVVKFVADDQVAAHAGESFWDGKKSCNAYGIGIEIIHWQPNPPGSAPIPPVTDAQYASLIALLKALLVEHGLKAHRIVGHSDVRTSKADPWLLGSDRQTCPGGMFEWTRLEAAGLGLIPKAGVAISDDWGGYFKSFTEALRFGDSDSRKIFGGKRRKDLSGVIVGLQRDLHAIGYSVKTNGEFDEYTRQAVDRFKRHFYTGMRSGRAPTSLAVSDRVDVGTASMILAVRMGLPGAPSGASQSAPAPLPPSSPADAGKPGTGGASGSEKGSSSLLPVGGDDEEGGHVYALDDNYKDVPETADS